DGAVTSSSAALPISSSTFGVFGLGSSAMAASELHGEQAWCQKGFGDWDFGSLPRQPSLSPAELGRQLMSLVIQEDALPRLELCARGGRTLFRLPPSSGSRDGHARLRARPSVSRFP